MSWAAKLRLLAQGVFESALREAQGDLMEVVSRVRGALQAKYESQGKKDVWPDLYAVFTDRAVVREEGVLQAYPFVFGADGAVTLGEPYRVEETFSPAATVMPPPPPLVLPQPGAALIEALGEDASKGKTFRIRVVKAGLSGNSNFYPDAVLREATPLFNGARVFVKSDAEHLQGQGKDVRNLIGQLSDAVFVEGKDKDEGEVQAVFHVLQTAGDISARLVEAIDRKMSNIFGFSMDSQGAFRTAKLGGKSVRMVSKIDKVKSVDLIVEPGAGGELINLIEAKQENNDMLRQTMIDMIKKRKPDAIKGLDLSTCSDADLESAFREAFPDEDPAKASAADQAASQAEQRFEARMHLREALADSRLPGAAQKRIKKLFDGKTNFTVAEVDAVIKDEREYLASFAESGRVDGLGGVRIEIGEDQSDKMAARLDAFFDPKHKDHRQAGSFREAYIDMTGDRHVTGRLDRCESGRLVEALDSTSLGLVLGDAINRRLVVLYNSATPLDLWREIAVVGRVSDFREQHRVAWGGYGDLPVVAEKGDYLALTSPDDEEAKFKVAKRGGTESLTLEMVKNDDVGAIRDIPNKLSRSAKRTLSRFVFNFILANPAIYDTKALFHADHGNLGTAALDKTSYAAGRVAMLRQTEPGSSEELFIQPRLLLVPAEKEEDSYNMFVRTTNNDPDFVATLRPKIIPVWCQTDTNDWSMLADPNEMPTIEVGFLDGQEEPELFVQDNPTVGSMFTSDTITYKIRHIYGGVIRNYRGARRNIVA